MQQKRHAFGRRNTCPLHDMQPVFRFVAFFERNLILQHKITSTTGIDSLVNIGSYACCRAEQLILQHGVTLYCIAETHNCHCEFETLFSKRV